MWDRLKVIINDNKTVISNFSYLSILQIFNLVLPLITYPYLIRVLSSEIYGKVIFAQAIVMYFSILINFGFNISGAKDVAEAKNDKNKLSEIVSSIYILKSLLWILSLIVYVMIVYLTKFRDDVYLYILTFGFTFMELLLPMWYFQGVEKMRFITIINVISRTLFTILIFVFVNNENDYLLVPIFNIIGFLIGGGISIYILIKYESIIFRGQTLNKLKCYFLESLPLFISLASIQVYVNANRVIVGSFLGMKEVAYYDLGEKVLKLLKIPVNILNQAVFPKLSREKDVKEINRFLILSLSVTSVLVTLVVVFKKLVVTLFIGVSNYTAELVLSILAISAVMVSISQFLGTSRMIIFEYRKAFSYIIISSGVFYLIGFSLLYSFSEITLVSISWLAASVEAWVVVVMFLFCIKKRILK